MPSCERDTSTYKVLLRVRTSTGYIESLPILYWIARLNNNIIHWRQNYEYKVHVRVRTSTGYIESLPK
jgi:hypothetical protein